MPLDRSEVKAIVDANVERIRDELRLHDWFIDIEYGPTSNERWAASCDRAGADYRHASITLDPEMHHSEEGVLRSLTHELIHLALASFDLYRDIITNLIPEMQELGSPVALAEQRAWTHAVETATTLLERGIARRLWETEVPEPEAADAAGLTD